MSKKPRQSQLKTSPQSPEVDDSEKNFKRLPTALRRMAALNFDWDTLVNICSSEEMRTICNDPRFWFEKLVNMKLALEEPIVLEWIQLWVGSPAQVSMIEAFANGSVRLPLISGLIQQEFDLSLKYLNHPVFKLNGTPFTQTVDLLKKSAKLLKEQIPKLIALQSVELNCNFAMGILRDRITKPHQTFEVPELSREIFVEFEPDQDDESGEDESDEKDEELEEQLFSFKTYEQYLTALKRLEILDFDHINFIDDSTLAGLLNDKEEYSDAYFRDYLDRNQEKIKAYREMAIKKAELIGHHLKIGDILQIGITDGDKYFVIPKENQINLYLIKDSRVFPVEAFDYLIAANIQTIEDLDRVFGQGDSFQTPAGGIFELLHKRGQQGKYYRVNGYTFYGKWQTRPAEQEEGLIEPQPIVKELPKTGAKKKAASKKIIKPQED